MPLVIKQDGKLNVALGENNWQAESTLVYLLHDPTPQLLKRLSGARKPSRQLVKPTAEKPPEKSVENLPEAPSDKRLGKSSKTATETSTAPNAPDSRSAQTSTSKTPDNQDRHSDSYPLLLQSAFPTNSVSVLPRWLSAAEA